MMNGNFFWRRPGFRPNATYTTRYGFVASKDLEEARSVEETYAILCNIKLGAVFVRDMENFDSVMARPSSGIIFDYNFFSIDPTLNIFQKLMENERNGKSVLHSLRMGDPMRDFTDLEAYISQTKALKALSIFSTIPISHIPYILRGVAANDSLLCFTVAIYNQQQFNLLCDIVERNRTIQILGFTLMNYKLTNADFSRFDAAFEANDSIVAMRGNCSFRVQKKLMINWYRNICKRIWFENKIRRIYVDSFQEKKLLRLKVLDVKIISGSASKSNELIKHLLQVEEDNFSSLLYAKRVQGGWKELGHFSELPPHLLLATTIAKNFKDSNEVIEVLDDDEPRNVPFPPVSLTSSWADKRRWLDVLELKVLEGIAWLFGIKEETGTANLTPVEPSVTQSWLNFHHIGDSDDAISKCDLLISNMDNVGGSGLATDFMGKMVNSGLNIIYFDLDDGEKNIDRIAAIRSLEKSIKLTETEAKIIIAVKSTNLRQKIDFGAVINENFDDIIVKNKANDEGIFSIPEDVDSLRKTLSSYGNKTLMKDELINSESLFLYAIIRELSTQKGAKFLKREEILDHLKTLYPAPGYEEGKLVQSLDECRRICEKIGVMKVMDLDLQTGQIWCPDVDWLRSKLALIGFITDSHLVSLQNQIKGLDDDLVKEALQHFQDGLVSQDLIESVWSQEEEKICKEVLLSSLLLHPYVESKDDKFLLNSSLLKKAPKNLLDSRLISKEFVVSFESRSFTIGVFHRVISMFLTSLESRQKFNVFSDFVALEINGQKFELRVQENEIKVTVEFNENKDFMGKNIIDRMRTFIHFISSEVVKRPLPFEILVEGTSMAQAKQQKMAPWFNVDVQVPTEELERFADLI